jgi:type VI secretion system protein VasG
VALYYDDTLVTEVAKRCTEVESGARNVDNILSNTLLPEISRELLGRMAEGLPPEGVIVGIGPDGKFTYAWCTEAIDAHRTEATARTEKPAA